MLTLEYNDRAHYNGQNGKIGCLSNSRKSQWFYPDGADYGFPVDIQLFKEEKPVFSSSRQKPTCPHGVHHDVIALAEHYGHEMEPWVHDWICRMAEQAKKNIEAYP